MKAYVLIETAAGKTKTVKRALGKARRLHPRQPSGNGVAERIRDVADTNTAQRLDWSHLADQDSQIPPARLREMRERDPGEPYVVAHGASPIRS